MYVFFSVPCEEVEEGQYYVTEFDLDKKNIYYIGKVLEQDGDEVIVNCLRRVGESKRFKLRDPEPDVCSVRLSQIRYKLPPPRQSGQTRRQRGAALCFDVLVPTNVDLK